eukprot:1251475-Prymnesium_polylepis.1
MRRRRRVTTAGGERRLKAGIPAAAPLRSWRGVAAEPAVRCAFDLVAQCHVIVRSGCRVRAHASCSAFRVATCTASRWLPLLPVLLRALEQGSGQRCLGGIQRNKKKGR